MQQKAWQLAYDDALKAQGAQTGGNVRTGVTAVVSALQALAGTDVKAALARGAAPYLAQQVKDITTGGKAWSELTAQELLNNTLAHALLYAGLAAK